MPIPSEKRIDYVVRHLRRAMPKNWGVVSTSSGVPEKTIHKIAYRETLDPRVSTLDALYDFFKTAEENHDKRFF